MRKPKEPKKMLGAMFYLTKETPVLAYHNGPTLVAPVGMQCRLVGVSTVGVPRVVFPACFWSSARSGFEVRWSSLTEKKPTCVTCGQDTAPIDLVAVFPTK